MEGFEEGGGIPAPFASLPEDPTLLEGIDVPLGTLRRALAYRAQSRIFRVLSGVFFFFLMIIALAALHSALTGPPTSWDNHPWAFVFGAGSLGCLYAWATVRPGAWVWGLLTGGWTSLILFVLIDQVRGGSASSGEEIALLVQACLFVLFHGFILRTQLRYRDLQQPRALFKHLRTINERMWMRSLETGAPMLALTATATRTGLTSTAHLSRVRGGWLLYWGNEACPIFSDEMSRIEEEGGPRLRLHVDQRVCLFAWPTSPSA